jgi:hypothetical protein
MVIKVVGLSSALVANGEAKAIREVITNNNKADVLSVKF